MLGEAIIFSWLTMTKINSSWDGYNERPPQLASTFFFIFSALIPVTFKYQRNVILWDLPLGCERPLLMIGGDWASGLRSLDRWQDSEDSHQVCGSHRKGKNACISSCLVWVTGVCASIKAPITMSLHLNGSLGLEHCLILNKLFNWNHKLCLVL